MKAVISDIKRFATHDGDGIRTTVFFKGCPLKCVWCHNPEGISFEGQIGFYTDKCISCLECTNVCRYNAHSFNGEKHIFKREKCNGCAQCESICPSSALKFYGKQMTMEQIMNIVMEDVDFYKSSGGGVTLSGGECLSQADFCTQLLRLLKENGINTAVDTSGFVPRASLDKVLPYTDTFLYDIKAIDEDVHKRCTGQSNTIILENLKYLDSVGKRIEIRVPYVPFFNDNEMDKIACFVKALKNVVKVKVLPYHNYAGSKYSSLGMENTLPSVLPTQQEINIAQKKFE